MAKIEQALDLIGLKVNQEFKWQDIKVSVNTYLCKVAQDGTVYVWSEEVGKWETKLFVNLRDLLYEPEKIKEVICGPIIGETYWGYVANAKVPKIWSIEPIVYTGSVAHLAMFERGFMWSDKATAEYHFPKLARKYGVVSADRVSITGK